jgi:hypothetical protein
MERPFDRDRVSGLRVVMKRLTEPDAHEEDEEDDERAQSPADQLPAPLLTPALVTLDGSESGHGS